MAAVYTREIRESGTAMMRSLYRHTLFIGYGGIGYATIG